VAQKLVDVASLVISVGKSCEMLGEEDLVPLQADLQHLQWCVDSILSSCRRPLTHCK
jgi:hypothetical protein